MNKDAFTKKATEQVLVEDDLRPLRNWVTTATEEELQFFFAAFTKGVRKGQFFIHNFRMVNEIVMTKLVDFLPNK